MVNYSDESIPIERVIQKHRNTGKFVKGPIPLWWLQRATKCSPSAVTVGMLLFHLDGMGRTDITISNEFAKRFGLSRNTKTKALRLLEQAGLVKLRRSGQRVVVTLLKLGEGGLGNRIHTTTATPQTYFKMP